MTRPPTMHLEPRRHTPDVHEGDWLFEGVGREDTLIEALYRVSLMQRMDVDAIDRALDAHLATHGEPEQLAYAKLPCSGYDRLFPLADPQPDGTSFADYAREHRAWNPPTARELSFAGNSISEQGPDSP